MKKIMFLMLICAMSSFSLMAQDEKVVLVDKGVKMTVDKIVNALDEADLSLYPQQLTALKEALQVERSSMSSIIKGNKGKDFKLIQPQINAIKQNTNDKLRKILKADQFAKIEQMRGVMPADKKETPKMKVNPNVGTMDALRKAPAEVGTVEEAPTKTVPVKEGQVSKPMVEEAPVKAVPKSSTKEMKSPTSKSPDAKMQTPNKQKVKPGKVNAPKKGLKSLDMMKSKLADGGEPLNAQQETQLERVLKAEKNAIQAARKHAGDDKDAFKTKAKEIRKSNVSQIKSILTSKQFKLIKALRKAQPE